MGNESTMFSEVRALPTSQLTTRVEDLLGRERHLVCEFLVHLAELERRELHLALGYRSLFTYLSDHLGLTNGSAYRRATAARLIRRCPQVVPYLRSGQLSLATLCLLRDVLEPASCTEVLQQAAGKTEYQVKVLVAKLRPRPEPKDLVRKLPTRTPSVGTVSSAAPAPQPSPVATSADKPGATSMMEVRTGPDAEQASAKVAPPPPAEPVPRPTPPPTFTPCSAERHILRMTVGDDFRQELEAVKQALSHKVPSGRL